LDDRQTWPALEIEARAVGLDDAVAAALDDYSPVAIEDLVPPRLPPGGLWDPTCPPPPEPAPSPIHWRVFFNGAAQRAAAAAELRAQFPELQLAFVDVDDENWAARSQRAMSAIRAGVFVVAPPWDLPRQSDRDAITIVIEPSRGFGTGHHASTRLCLRALSSLDVRDRLAFDLGTGSGVLAMAAALKGAREVVAVDVDPDAIDAARESAALNALPPVIEFRVADFRQDSTIGRADLVLANLTGAMLISSASQIQSLLAPGGALVLSGFDENEREAVRNAYAVLELHERLVEEGWAALVLRSKI
jgi:ribosomal protein L11 methyltransferase